MVHATRAATGTAVSVPVICTSSMLAVATSAGTFLRSSRTYECTTY